MGKPVQTGEITVQCNTCKKQQKVRTLDYYVAGGMRGCCTVERSTGANTPPIQVRSTFSTVPAGKRKTHKPSRDRVARSSRK